jgi:hypothetical protein
MVSIDLVSSETEFGSIVSIDLVSSEDEFGSEQRRLSSVV